MFMSVDLPLPEVPTTRQEGAFLDREVDAPQGVDGDVSDHVGLLQPLDPNDGIA